MALVTVITVDLLNSTATLNVTKNAVAVEVITYDNILKRLTFSQRAAITITGQEFIDLFNQINIFETAIIFNFGPDINKTLPFSQVNSIEQYDSVAKLWNFDFTVVANPKVSNYEAILSSRSIRLLNRNAAKTIEFSEWIYWLLCLTHYRLSVKNYLSLQG